jgi:hypothetical protein
LFPVHFPAPFRARFRTPSPPVDSNAARRDVCDDYKKSRRRLQAISAKKGEKASKNAPYSNNDKTAPPERKNSYQSKR